ncbi:MAG: alpha/beta hydrolase [Alkalilacustris sp.]
MAGVLATVLRLAAWAAGALVLAVTALALAQDRLIFPRWAMGPPAPLPAGVEALEARSDDGHRLQGVLIPARDGGAAAPLLLAFGGNAWDAHALAGRLHALTPERAVAAFHYRGYGLSEGRPGAAAILADAGVVFDAVAGHPAAAAGVIAVGLSLGAGPAAEVAATRPVAGVVLVTPFESLHALARTHYPWAPVGWLLRHRMEVAATVARVTAPVAVIAAGADTVVPPARTAPVRAAAPRLVADITLEGAGHNDLYDRAAFAAALTEALAAIKRAGPGAAPR